MNTQLAAAVAAGTLGTTDAWLATHLAARAGRDDDLALLVAIAAVSQAATQGDACIAIAELAGTALFADADSGHAGITAPSLDDWLATLRGSGLVGDTGEASTYPLVLDAAHRLYLHRLFRAEQVVARALRARASLVPDACGDAAPGFDARLAAELARRFPRRAAGDRQVLGAAVAALHNFSVISGGPGTGKTTTVARLLAVLVALAGDRPPVIRLAAPTGKAAARLSQSLRLAREAMVREHGDDACLTQLPLEAVTLHRLLGLRGDGAPPRHDADNPLPLDVLVVDEASMIDLGVMARLLEALPPTARLVLLGDRDQLASVEAGNVLGDICRHGEAVGWSNALVARLRALGLETATQAADAAPAATGGALADSLVVLTHSHRFSADGGIGRAAAAINAGQVDVIAALADDAFALRAPVPGELPGMVAAEALAGWKDLLAGDDAAACLARFERFRFLCALREGDTGVAGINRLVEQALARAGVIDLRDARGNAGHYTGHYAGRPLLVVRNDYATGLYNGDVGLVLRDPASGTLRAFFADAANGVRSVALHRLPPHETAWAMTVHKSQGSEFERVVLVLPDEPNPVLTRELVYTGITRARRSAVLWGSREIVAQAVAGRVVRQSGLRDALWSEVAVG